MGAITTQPSSQDPDAGRSMEFLRNRYAGMPAFVVGNGRSRLLISDGKDFYDKMSEAGLLIVCNRLCLEPLMPRNRVDVWSDTIFDGEYRETMWRLSSQPLLAVTDELHRDDWNFSGRLSLYRAVPHFDRRPFFFKGEPGRSAQPPYSTIQHSCTGNAAFQIAHFMGCDPINLIGFDYLDGNVYIDLLTTQKKIIKNGYETNTRLAEWADTMMHLAEAMQRFDNRRIFRLAGPSLLHSIPEKSFEQMLER